MSTKAAPKSILKKKATATIPASSKASSSKGQPKASVKIARKRKAEPETEDEESVDDEDANASGFEDDGMDVDGEESELDTGDEIDLAKSGGDKSKKNTST